MHYCHGSASDLYFYSHAFFFTLEQHRPECTCQ